MSDVEDKAKLKKSHKAPVARRISTVSLPKLDKCLLTVLMREVKHLMDLSYSVKLNKDNSASLRDYLKLIKELRKQIDEEKDSDITVGD